MILILFLINLSTQAGSSHFCSDLSDENRFQECIFDISQRIYEIKGDLNAEIFETQSSLQPEVYSIEGQWIKSHKPRWEGTIDEITSRLLSSKHCNCPDVVAKRSEFYQKLTDILNAMVEIQTTESGVVYNTKKSVRSLWDSLLGEDEIPMKLPDELKKEYVSYRFAVEAYDEFHRELLSLGLEEE